MRHTYHCIMTEHQVEQDQFIGGRWSDMSENARVWVFTADRWMDDKDLEVLSHEMTSFTGDWKAHQVDLKAGWLCWKGRVLLVAVDEEIQEATGCSIDALTHCMQSVGMKMGIDWFNRMQVIHQMGSNDWVQTPMHEFWALRKAGRVQDSDFVINALAKTKGDWQTTGIQQFKDSWHASMW